MKTTRLSTLFLIVTLLINTEAQAVALVNSNNSQFYYDIGGASSITAPLYRNSSSPELSGSAEFGLGYSCGKFNINAGIANIMNSLSGLGDTLVNGAIGAVTSAIASLPALILQRLNPGLYDLFQNALIRAEASIALANKTCEQYEADIRQNKNPYSDWTDISKAIDWKIEMESAYGGGDTDVNRAKKKVESNNGRNGLPWVGGTKAGGEDQDPIKVTEGLVKAGYNLSLNQPADSDASASVTESRLKEVFPSPASATTWGKEVLGDVHIKTHDNRPVTSVPGHGLAPKIEKEMILISTKLTEIVNNTGTTPSIANLKEVSSDDTRINYDLIRAIQHLEPSERSIAIAKLSSEIAMSRSLEKALFLRRMLITGLREPNISSIPQAIDYGKDAVHTIDQEIDNVLFEKRIRKELASKTALSILSWQEGSEKRGSMNVLEGNYDKSVIQDGSTK